MNKKPTQPITTIARLDNLKYRGFIVSDITNKSVHLISKETFKGLEYKLGNKDRFLPVYFSEFLEDRFLLINSRFPGQLEEFHSVLYKEYSDFISESGDKLKVPVKSIDLLDGIQNLAKQISQDTHDQDMLIIEFFEKLLDKSSAYLEFWRYDIQKYIEEQTLINNAKKLALIALMIPIGVWLGDKIFKLFA